ncbi:hypothetical protein HDU79_010077 [Rhizoclosmatium sp. JEL0117]|nr:hypothetical protein HDU79_010077 [Rhizoclosmatium sp. JEL0117]
MLSRFGVALNQRTLAIATRHFNPVAFQSFTKRSYAGHATSSKSTQLNVFGEPLIVCCTNPMTGFFRTGYCETEEETDLGIHTICAYVTEEFLAHQRKIGNDLVTPRPQFSFPGLKPGDHWCVCAKRWKESLDAGIITKVKLQSTHMKTLRVLNMTLEELQQYGK